jgi:hypothetical protein
VQWENRNEQTWKTLNRSFPSISTNAMTLLQENETFEKGTPDPQKNYLGDQAIQP